MSKNILILTGSPRENGNTAMLANAFTKGAQRKGHKVHIFHTAKKKINPCIACNTCWSKGRPCSFDEDCFDELWPLLEAADILVFCTPLYFYSFSAQLKAAIDKLYPYVSASVFCPRPLKITESILLACAQDKEYQSFSGLIASFKEIGHHLNWKTDSILAVNNVYNQGEIEKTDALEKAEQLGSCI